MYHEFRNDCKRTGWLFTYKASEIIECARDRLAHYTKLEHDARKIISELMLDKTVASSDKRIEDARSAVAHNGAIVEQLDIWVHEFHRNPDREYQLALGDVVFFELH